MKSKWSGRYWCSGCKEVRRAQDFRARDPDHPFSKVVCNFCGTSRMNGL